MDLVAYLLSFLSYRVVLTCLLSVPFTHSLGLYLYAPLAHQKGSNGILRGYLLLPFAGGGRHLIFLILGWVRSGIRVARAPAGVSDLGLCPIAAAAR